MSHSMPVTKLTHQGAFAALGAAIAAAEKMGVPQCIALVDASGAAILSFRMDGARFLSMRTAMRKAITSASLAAPAGSLPDDKALPLALGTDGDFINLKGGLPIFIDKSLVGAIGVGSGTSEQDVEVARAAIAAISGASEQL